ncbi:TrmB family transcriptional regulator [Haloferax namakaokahaiae]|uniref:TrmB family transcriptional regulator n=1 Tax=Haloferax namakaokahaiae TaxID=1748331 RepID=A0ABD5ZB85_9EURY
MSTEDALEEAIDVLQQLGLKEYEARCFVGLSRLSSGTAKQLSEITDVPRTRVYDAVRVLEAQGLVEVQHSSPQRFRAVSLPEATDTLRDQYEARVNRLTNALERAEKVSLEDDKSVQEVWAMTGSEAIRHRTSKLVSDASTEVVLIIGDEPVLTDELVNDLNEGSNEVDLLVGTVDESLLQQVEDAVPNAETFVSELEWLRNDTDIDEVTIGRLLLVDRSAILVSTVVPETGEEQAIFGEGFKNGLVVITRRLMAQGLVPARDPNT